MASGSSRNLNRPKLLFCLLLENHINSVAFHHFVHISKNILLSGAYLLTLHDIKFTDKEKNKHQKAGEEGRVPTTPKVLYKEKYSFEKK